MCNGAQARVGGRGRGAPTIIYIKEIIRFNNNNNNNHFHPRATPFTPGRGSPRWEPPPPLRGGSSSSPESPAHPIPSYPALCREDTTSWNYGRPRTHTLRAAKRIASYTHELRGSIHVCHAQNKMARLPFGNNYMLMNLAATNAHCGDSVSRMRGFPTRILMRESDSWCSKLWKKNNLSRARAASGSEQRT